ncbi:putative flavin dependent monooxygenase [Biscogniauxia mediterranea]|nr:putative flavin dependent monooxygenase [Biscogniauxia mediterranea]
MSPTHLENKLNVNRVAVIGAGPCGLAAAKYLVSEKKFAKIEVFEQRSAVGGIWNYTPLNVLDREFTIPRTKPSKLPDTAIWADGVPGAQFVSPVYDFLETNIPNTLMNYSDQTFPEGSSLFPKHAVVKQYLEDYARELRPILSLHTQVLGVEKISSGKKSCWQVETLDMDTNQKRITEFDAVIVASGHYNDPFIPDIKGLGEFNRTHPGCISHSKFYRRPDQYKGKKVVIVGNSASGIDLSAQISAVCQQPIIVSEKAKPVTAVEEKPWAKLLPEVSEFLPAERAVRFSDGTLEKDIDAVVFCTGYFYSFPFLKSLPSPVVTDGSYAKHLYEHILYIDDPTLSFLGIPQRVVPFPLSEVQSGYVARLLAGRLPLPSHETMLEWESKMLKEKGESKLLHNLAFPKDVDYINRLHGISMSAKKVQGLDNDGVGKIPPYWGADKAWARERFPLIKIASRALGEKRHEVKTLEELGFDFQAWRAAKEAEQKLTQTRNDPSR